MSNIIETAIAANVFSNLVIAMNATDLTETLTRPGPYTVFAPNDEAFARLPAGTLAELLGDIPGLKQLLTYHVIEDRLLFRDVMKLATVQTLQGQRVGIATNSGGRVNQAKFIQTDIVCDNGIIHVLDTVLTLPSAKSTAG